MSQARSWLGRIHNYILRYDPAATHDDRLSPTVDSRQWLVAIGNRLELDVEALLAAGSEPEVRLVYEGSVVLEEA